MSIKSLLAKPFAAWEVSQYNKHLHAPHEAQERIFRQLLTIGAQTTFGKEHGFPSIRNHDDFKRQVPVRDYEGLKPYIEQIQSGEMNVLWKGRPKYFAKTSGTTSGVKYIPVSHASIRHQVEAARLALQYYNHESGRTAWVDGKMIFLQGSPEMEDVGGIPTGRLSGITYHEVPSYLLKNRKPTYATNCIEDWEAKVGRIVEETMYEDMTLISGIAPWVIMYFEKLLERTGRDKVADVFPNLEMYVHGGVNFAPYESAFRDLIGKEVAFIETYPASEGFIAFQHSQYGEGLVLHVDGGIFFEFIPANEVFNEHPTRVSLKDVELNVNYAVILNTNAGLWGYNIGDTVRFVSKHPYRLVVTGRIKHFISAFGEHVIGEEVESAMVQVCKQTGTSVREFTVAPLIQVAEGLPRHEWLIDFETCPADICAFALQLDAAMRERNIYYDDLIKGNILQPLQITVLQENAFRKYMESQGKLGGQNKIPRLGNDRRMAEALVAWVR